LSNQDKPQLTDEGKKYCQEGSIKAEDLLIKTFADFKEDAEVDEVAQIRFDHYRNKRLRKLAVISKIFENIVYKKRLDAE
jgi:hypothetical protein